jgi:hypothetical protein
VAVTHQVNSDARGFPQKIFEDGPEFERRGAESLVRRARSKKLSS